MDCVTLDGVRVSLLANLNRLEELALVDAHQLDGVGLFRTEFLYIDSPAAPSFERQRNRTKVCLTDCPAEGLSFVRSILAVTKCRDSCVRTPKRTRTLARAAYDSRSHTRIVRHATACVVAGFAAWRPPHSVPDGARRKRFWRGMSSS